MLTKERRRVGLQAGLLIAAGWFVYAPAFHGAKLWDDRVEFPAGWPRFSLPLLAKIWTGAWGNDYYPLKTTVQWLGSGWWGADTLGFHLINGGCHLLSAFLLWNLLAKFGLKQAWLGGLLWVVHPLAVESVAWLSELKNVLALPPLLLALRSYCDYDRAGHGPSPLTAARRRHLVSALAWFGVAMLCKSSAVMFPVVLLLYAVWRRGRIAKADLWASAPFFAVSLLLGLVEVGYQLRAIGGAKLVAGSALARAAVAGLAAVFYLAKAVFPANLSPEYPRWAVDPPSALQFLPWLGLGLVVVWLWRRGSGRSRTVLFGLGFFFVNLLPVLGFVPMSYQRISWVGDQLAYLPLVGLVGLAAASLQGWETWAVRHRVIIVFGVAGLLAAGAVTGRRYAAQFRSEEALWSDTLERNPKAWAAHNNLGVALAESGRTAEAIAHYRAALLANPIYADAHNNLGIALAKAGRLPEALAEYQEALRLQPDFADAHRNRGRALAASGRRPEAVMELQEALRLQPDYAQAHNDLGLVWAEAGRAEEALAQYHAALRLDPGMAEAEYNLGSLLYSQGRTREAIDHLETALRLQPDYAEAHANLGIVLTAAGHLDEAEEQFKTALRLRPDLPEVHYNLGIALATARRPQEAIAEFQAALRQRPDDAAAENNLAVAYAAIGRVAEAALALETAVRLEPANAAAHENLARMLQVLGQGSRAHAEMLEAARLKPARP